MSFWPNSIPSGNQTLQWEIPELNGFSWFVIEPNGCCSGKPRLIGGRWRAAPTDSADAKVHLNGMTLADDQNMVFTLW
jgi:hypothetical protein